MIQKELNLCHKRLVKLIKDYDYIIDYHLGKKNVVVDALSHRSSIRVNCIQVHDQLKVLELRKTRGTIM
jgi:hypothetical protein